MYILCLFLIFNKSHRENIGLKNPFPWKNFFNIVSSTKFEGKFSEEFRNQIVEVRSESGN